MGGRARAFAWLEFTRRFEKSFARLASKSREQCEEALEQLVHDPLLPGLHLKPIRPSNIFWEARLNSGGRIILLPESDGAVVMDVVRHDDIARWGTR